jgi:hypothetical protein
LSGVTLLSTIRTGAANINVNEMREQLLRLVALRHEVERLRREFEAMSGIEDPDLVDPREAVLNAIDDMLAAIWRARRPYQEAYDAVDRE